ncbi:uncharacterized protein LOC117108408 [Anneissia japonica]|uniref:uncharacterized protein LOC117108408 n=1 Tax=Anneissia japonica TaxID=1529436 RepID=UPI00142553A1|nr:uncharacterized protein LOC117108408 [Anneissia japonica]
MTDAIDKQLRPNQAGFRKGMGCIDQIFAIRNIIEQCTEWQRKLYVNFIDFEKDFDSIHRDSLWDIFRKYGIPQELVLIIKSVFDNYTCRVGHATAKQKKGIRWTLFSTLEDLYFAVDLALFSHCHDHLQEKTTQLNEVAKHIGSKVTSDEGAGKVIKNRLNKARNAFSMLNNVWKSQQYSIKTKLKLYQSCVLSTLLYGSECWRMTKVNIHKPSVFHTKSLRRIHRISGQTPYPTRSY